MKTFIPVLTILLRGTKLTGFSLGEKSSYHLCETLHSISMGRKAFQCYLVFCYTKELDFHHSPDLVSFKKTSFSAGCEKILTLSLSWTLSIYVCAHNFLFSPYHMLLMYFYKIYKLTGFFEVFSSSGIIKMHCTYFAFFLLFNSIKIN